jgi:carbonic anhydrase/acetyltransferase-like protein (isoleucine patch superfamily)
MFLMPNAQVLPYKGKLPEIQNKVFIASGAQVIGNLKIGQESSIWFNAVVRADENWITIGRGSNIQDNSVVHITHNTGPTQIGDFVTVGHNAIIHACTIGNYCLIGMGAIILDKAEIPPYSLIGAGSLIAPGKTFPTGHLILGNPAKAVRPLTEKEMAYFEYSAEHYMMVARNYMM